MNEAAACQRRGMVGTQFERLITILQGFTHEPQRCPRPTAIVEGDSVVGVEVDDLTEVLNGTPVVALRKEGRAAVGKRLCQVWPALPPRADHDCAAANLAVGRNAFSARAADPS